MIEQKLVTTYLKMEIITGTPLIISMTSCHQKFRKMQKQSLPRLINLLESVCFLYEQ